MGQSQRRPTIHWLEKWWACARCASWAHPTCLVGSGINYIDASAVETLRELIERLHDAGVAFYLADVKGPVLDQLYRAGLIGELGEDHVFLSTHEAMVALTDKGPLPFPLSRV